MRTSQRLCAVLAMASGVVAGWTELAEIPTLPRQEHSVVAINSTTLAVIGGIELKGTVWGNTELVTYYDIPSDTWIDGPSMPLGLNHPNAVAVDGTVYLLGGLAETEEGPWVAVPETWSLDPLTGRWQSLMPFPEGTERGAAVVGAYDDKIYLAGGLTSLDLVGNGGSPAVNAFSAYNIATNEWTTFPEQGLPTPKDHAGGAVIGNTMWITGGRHISAGVIQTRHVLSINLDDVASGWTDWTDEAPMPTSRGGHMAAAIGDKIYAFGGEGIGPDTGVFEETEVFDTTTKTWKSLEAMPSPRHGTVGVAIGGAIYIAGGGQTLGTDPTNSTAVFTPTSC